MVHPIIVARYPDEHDIFDQQCGDPGTCPFGVERCTAACCPRPFKVFTFERRQ
jgi:hypothetical protein